LKQRNAIILGTILLLIGLVFNRCGEETDQRKAFVDARSYNDFITKEVVKIDSLYLQAMMYQNEKVSREKTKTLAKQTAISLRRLNIQPFKGDSTLCVAAKKFILHFNRITEKTMPEFFHLCYSMCQKDAFSKRASQINLSATYLDDEYGKQWKELSAAQRNFSKKFNLKLK